MTKVCPVSILLLVLFLFSSGCIENKPTAVTEVSTPISTPLPKQYINMDYENFVKPLKSLDELTDLQKQNFYNSLNQYNGKYVQWRLQVLDVAQDGIKLSRITLYDTAVVLYVAEDQISKLNSLNKRDIITIEGMINDETIESIKMDYKYGQGIRLYDGKIIRKG